MSIRVNTTLTPYQSRIVKGLKSETGLTESKVVQNAVKEYIQKMPPDQRQRIEQNTKV